MGVRERGKGGEFVFSLWLGCNHAAIYSVSHTDLSDPGSEAFGAIQNSDRRWKDVFGFV